MCIVKVGDMTKKTEKRKNTLNPLFDKIFNFEIAGLKRSELEQMKIQIIIQDSGIFTDGHLGGYEIDLTSVYFNQNHMFLKTWFTLFDFDEELEGCIGFVKATIEVLGPGDEPTITEAITDDPTIEKTVISPKIRPKGHLIMAEIYRAEFLSPLSMTSRNVDPYVRIKYGGMYKDTKKISSSSNPEFNQIIFLPAILPNHSKDVFIELWHDFFFADSLIGTAKIPFNIFKDSNNMKPRWINIYGPPLTSHNEYAIKMAKNGYKIGTTFRGRLLVRFSSRDEKSPISQTIHMKYRIPEMIIPIPMTKMYTLRIDVFEGSVLPTKDKGILHFCIGPYLIKSSLKKVDEGKSIYWNESIKERRVNLPLDIEQIPDLIIYFCDEDAESHRVSYTRKVPAKFVVYNSKTFEENQKAMILKFREDKSHKRIEADQFPGFAVVRVVLFAHSPPPRKENLIILSNRIEKKKYLLKLLVYVARELPSSEKDGTSNPMVEFKVGGQYKETKMNICTENTLNPNFYEVIDMNIELNTENSSPPTLIILVYHVEKVNGLKTGVKTLLGRFWLLLEIHKKKKYLMDRKTGETIDLVYFKPQWIPLIYDKEDKVDGRLLMGYVLVEETKKNKNFLDIKLDIKPEYKEEKMTMWAFGVRNLKFEKNLPKNVTYDIKINPVDPEKINLKMEEKNKSENLDLKKTSFNNFSINESKEFFLQIPKLRDLCPVMEVFVHNKSLTGEKKILGVGQYPLSETLAYFYKNAEDIEYINKWKDFFELGKLKRTDENKLKNEKIKLPKFKTENMMVYYEDLIFEVKAPTIKKSKQRQTKSINNGNENLRNEIYEENSQKKTNSGLNRQGLIQQQKSIVNIPDEHENLIKEEKNEYLQPLIDENKQNVEEENNSQNEKKEGINLINIMQQKVLNEEKMSNFNESNEYETLKGEESVKEEPIKDKEEFRKQKEKEEEEFMNKIKDKLNEKKDEILLERIKNEDMHLIADESAEFSNFGLSSKKELSEQSGEISQKDLKFDEVFVEENEDAKLKKNKNEMNRFFSNLKLKNPFAGILGKKKKKGIEYQEFDTDEEEDYDDVLPYLKGRTEYQDDLEDVIFTKNTRLVEEIPVYQGNSREKETMWDKLKLSFGSASKVEKNKIGLFKFLFIRGDRSDLVPLKKINNFLQSVSKPKKYLARVYVLRGLQITGLKDKDQGVKTFLRLQLNNNSPIEDKDSERQGLYPEYYRVYEFVIEEIPGTAVLRIEIIEKDSFLSKNVLIGYTEIDLEERHFSIKWNRQEKKPVEKRNIMNDMFGSRGRLEMWIDILPEGSREPRTVIFPKEQLPYELRVIVWETKDCVFKDEVTEANDLFARGGVMRNPNFIETDTHWRCRNKGSFNWRWKFQINLPVDENKNYGEDQFIIQLWDRDIIARNDLIGELQIDLNIHKLLKKAQFRKKAVDMRMRIKGSGQETNMIWFEVFHPEKIDENGNKIVQGRVCLSFECVPKDLAEKFVNEVGRAAPNFFPTLPDPVGRFSFDLLSPCKTIKEIIGPKLCYKIVYSICYVIFMIVLIFVGYYVLTTYLGVSVANL